MDGSPDCLRLAFMVQIDSPQNRLETRISQGLQRLAPSFNCIKVSRFCSHALIAADLSQNFKKPQNFPDYYRARF
jgi:hypothetical protein